MIRAESEILNSVLLLVSRAVNGTDLKEDEITNIRESDTDMLRRFAKFHSIGAMTYFPLEKAGITDSKWRELKEKSVRNMILLEIERGKIFTGLEKAGIPFMPLKGTILAKMYPREGMREMADTDVLIDKKRQSDARTVMESLGYKTEAYDVSVHDVYQKPPIFDVELHTALFGESFTPEAQAYYDKIWERLVCKEEGLCEKRFTPEDFYVYIVAHMSKHLSHSGTGIRSLADIYVYLSRQKDLSREKIDAELEKIGLLEIEKTLRSLSFKLFSEKYEDLSDEEAKLLSEVAESGTYGTIHQRVEKQLANIAGEPEKVTIWTKIKFLLKRLFPGAKHIKNQFPICKKHPILIPFYTVFRWTHIFKRKKEIKSELKALK